jgi:glycosyltransferase involved in cell wall biosynthesis
MILAALPTGSFHGWGVCGKYIVKELSRMTEVRLVTEGFDMNAIGDELDFRLLQGTLVSDREQQWITSGQPLEVDHPVLQAINNITGSPNYPCLRGTNNVGYTFFENNILPASYIESNAKFFDIVVTGSSWCEDVLRSYGLRHVTTIIQGIDPTIFNPLYNGKEYLQDHFVVFSGGKFELRKGQDIVIRAYKVLQDRYRDTVLVNSWFNQWPASMHTMAASPHIRFAPAANDYVAMINQTLGENGIDVGRVITLPLYPNIMMPRLYKNTDIGFFPNRCEGGTNLVMMEYMACGKPVIASFSSGHKDVLTDGNCLKLENMRSIAIANNDQNVATWDEPDLEEAVAKLDWAYHHRDALRQVGDRAGEDLRKMTWQETGKRFYAILVRN